LSTSRGLDERRVGPVLLRREVIAHLRFRVLEVLGQFRRFGVT